MWTMPPELLRAPFIIAQLRSAGVPEQILRVKRFTRLFEGVYASTNLPAGPAVQLAGALLVAPLGSFAMLASAAQMLGLADASAGSPQIGLRPGVRKPTVGGIEWHAYGRLPSLVLAEGLPVTDPVSTFLDCAARYRLVEAVIIGDALVRREFATCEQLIAAARHVRGLAGLRASRAAVFVRPRVDSPMETRLRLLIVFAGLPEPMTNRDAYSPGGRWLARPDLSWPQVFVSVEYDGAHYFATDRQRRSDNRRRTGMADHGWVEIAVMSEDLFIEPWRLLLRIRRALAERGVLDLPDRLDAGWREVA